jgi:hypothetical protein
MAGSARPAHSQSQMYIYPAKGQNQQQQDKDRYECHTWAVQQSGFDPSKAYPSNPNHYDPQPYNPSQPHVMRGAGRGAAMGAVGGAIGGNAGKGAAAGAAVWRHGGRISAPRRAQAARCCATAATSSSGGLRFGRVSARDGCVFAGTRVHRQLTETWRDFPFCRDLDDKTV